MPFQGDGIADSWSDPHTALGHCFAMNGSQGFVEFRLNQLVEAEMLVLEHAIPKISFDGGASAIKDFRVMVSSISSRINAVYPPKNILAHYFTSLHNPNSCL